MKKLNALGIGPKIGMVAIPYLILSIVLTVWLKPAFALSENLKSELFIIGIFLFSFGLLFYAITVVLLLKGIKHQQLITTGTYYLCQNPLYASMILMLIPGLGLMMNSWLILSTSMVAWLRYKNHIKIEYVEMEDFFGPKYLDYQRSTPRFFPFPFKKWIR
jgi:protein-S-isoprenylcysteine O-methyltransferase Ste14